MLESISREHRSQRDAYVRIDYRIVVLRGGVHGRTAHTATPPTCAGQLINGGRGVRNVIGKSEKDVCIGRELGANVNATRSRG